MNTNQINTLSNSNTPRLEQQENRGLDMAALDNSSKQALLYASRNYPTSTFKTLSQLLEHNMDSICMEYEGNILYWATMSSQDFIAILLRS